METLKQGERVVHPLFGLGTVLTDESKACVEVHFDENDKKLLALKYVSLRRVRPDEEDAIRAQAQAGFEDTFLFESSNNHSPGSHWSPFYENVLDEVFRKLPSIMPQCGPAMGVSSFDTFKPPVLPGDWPKASKLRWPQRDSGIHFVLHNETSARAVKAVFPVIGGGTQVTVEIKKVHVFESRMEAQVDAKIGAAVFTFYDTDFVINAGWYRAHARMDFILCGLAYQCQIADEPDIVLAEDSPALDAMRKAATIMGDDPAAISNRMRFKGMAALLPIDGCDIDNYQFRGTVKAIKSVSVLDQACWLLTVCVLRSLDAEEREFHLPILVTSRVWKDSKPPQVGDDVIGTVWLQGRLWSPPGR